MMEYKRTIKTDILRGDYLEIYEDNGKIELVEFDACGNVREIITDETIKSFRRDD